MKNRYLVRGVHYTVREAGVGRPLLLLHGFTGSGAVFEELMDHFASTSRVIVPDLLGHGESDAPCTALRYSMQETVADLAALLTILNIARTDVLGYSMGGRVGLGFALSFPQRVSRLILEGASPGLATDEARMSRKDADAALAQRIEANGVELFVESWERIPLFHSQSVLDEQVRMRQRNIRLGQRAEGLAGSLRGLGTGSQPSYWDRLPSAEAQSLLVTGEMDEKFCEINQGMAAVMPRARHLIVPGCGHSPHLEKPIQFLSIVESFLTGDVNF